MLKVISSMAELPLEHLEQVYGQAVDEEYLRFEFFHIPGAKICLWYVEGVCVSALRLEPWRDGLLLTGLETAPLWRNQGYAGALLLAVQSHLAQQGSYRLYAHIHKRNLPSVRVHERCGFRMISDTAALLDGTVTAQMGTYLLEF